MNKQHLSSPFQKVHSRHSMPSRIIIPSVVNKKLSVDPSQPSIPKPIYEKKHLQNVNSVDFQNMNMFESAIPTTSTEPPMVWFPGNSDCSNQDSGALIYLIMLLRVDFNR